nr:redox-sensing transcriptional repressor Rex [Maliibacterium massiliense]
MPQRKISEAVIRRLPRYHRYLCMLQQEGVQRISSQRLSQAMHLTASQIRQDLNCFGGFGQQGYGYAVPELRRQVARILGLDRRYNVVIIGAGHIGSALIHYQGFKREGFDVVAAFDIDSRLVGTTVDTTPVLPIDALASYLGSHSVHIGAITSPGAQAQQVVDTLVAGGVRAIWNFAPVDVLAPQDVHVENVRLSDSLCVLSYYLSNDAQERL